MRWKNKEWEALQDFAGFLSLTGQSLAGQSLAAAAATVAAEGQEFKNFMKYFL